MAVTRDLYKRQGQFTATATDNGYNDIDNGVVLLEPDKSYSQTFTVANTATDEQIDAVLDAILSLSIGDNERQAGIETGGGIRIVKKITSTYILIAE